MTRKSRDDRFDILFAMCGVQVYGVALGMTGDADDAETVMRSALAKIAGNPPVARGRGHAMTAIYRATIDETWKLQRRRAKRPWVSLGAVPLDSSAEGSVTKVTEQSEDPVKAKDVEARMAALIQELPRGYREPVVLHDIQGLPYEATARLMGLEVTKLKSHLNRARLHLRFRLDEPFLHRPAGQVATPT